MDLYGKLVKTKKRSDSGEVMIESIIVIILTIFILVFILGLGFLLVQKWTINTVAEDTANKIAQTYKLTYTDPVTGYTGTADLKNISLYRNSLFKSVTEIANQAKAKSYANYRMKKTSFGNLNNTQISMQVDQDSLSRAHVVVTVKTSYVIPFGVFLKPIGIDGTLDYEATAVAECQDLSDYINTVDFVKAVTSDTLGLGSSELIKLFNNILRAVSAF